MRREAALRRTPPLIRLYRLVRLIAHLAAGLAISGCVFPFVGHQRQLRIIRRWSRGVLDILNVRLHVHGSLPRGHAPTMIVTNHVSWLDIWIIHSISPVRFVAKSDIRQWPVAGWLVARAGTIFIERARRHDTARTNRHIVEVLERGERVGVFPEGTTTDGTHVKPFHASLFQPALSAGARVVTAAIRYPLPGGQPNLDASYAGDRSLGESLRLLLRHPRLRAELIFTGVVQCDGKTRREVAHECHALIVRALHPDAQNRRPDTAAGLRAAAR